MTTVRLARCARPACVIVALALATGALAGCRPASSPAPSESAQPTQLTVGLGFIPSVQFAPYYLAQQAGYYREAGLEVTFQNESDPNLVTLVGQGAVDIGNADGTSVIPAVSQGIPVRYVFTVYARFPSVVFAKAGSGIREPADLDGRRLGIPFKAGSSWIMLQALLASAGLSPDDLDIVEFPDFGQLVAVAEGVVDAATGFVNNEPVRMRLAGEEVTVLTVDEITPLPGPGLIVGEQTLAEKHDALLAFVAATRRAMEEITADPERGLEAAIARVPELASEREAQLAVLEATIATWTSDYTREHGLGAIDRVAWAASVEFMGSLPGALGPNPVTVDALVSEDLLDE